MIQFFRDIGWPGVIFALCVGLFAAFARACFVESRQSTPCVDSVCVPTPSCSCRADQKLEALPNGNIVCRCKR